MSKVRIKELEELILKCKKHYYSHELEKIMEDEEYDALEDELKRLDPKNKVLSIVGSNFFSSEPIKHDTKMLSLEKTYVKEDITKFMGEEEIVSIFKVDGSSCSLVYEDGILSLAKTRGDGIFGENITKSVYHIPSVPKNINYDKNCEVRGEIYCSKSNFHKLVKEMEKRGLDKPTSERNIVAGILGRKEHKDLASYLSFFGFKLISPEDFGKEIKALEILKKNGFELPKHHLIKDQKGIDNSMKEMEDFMENGDYLIDGIVYVYNRIDLHHELGETGHHPKYSKAFKVQGEVKETEIKEIDWQISKFGIYTPVAHLEPVNLGGAMISKVTLHNLSTVKEFELKAGDRIKLIRSGEVIPKFISVAQRAEGEVEILKDCKFCDTKLKEDDVRLFCPNEDCSGRHSKYLLNFVKKMGIEDLSEKRVQLMIDEGLVSTIPDLYKLTEEALLTLPKVKEKMASKIIKNISSSKEIEIGKFFDALSFEGGAKNKTKLVIQDGKDSLEKIRKVKVEELIKLDGFQEKSANDYVNSLNSNSSLIDELLSLGITLVFPKRSGDKFQGMSICITGTLSVKRSVIEALIKENGGRPAGSVSSKTSFLICNDTTSSKYKKAVEKNIPILTEDEFKSTYGLDY